MTGDNDMTTEIAGDLALSSLAKQDPERAERIAQLRIDANDHGAVCYTNPIAPL
jgi:hypothetical protein